MMTETDKARAMRAFRIREERRRERVKLAKLLLCLGLAELIIILAFFVR